MSKGEMIEFFKDQIKLEHRIVEAVTNSLRNVRNPIVKQVLRAIAFDSQKHAGIYNAAISITKVTPALTDKEYMELKEITARHIADEEKALAALDKIMPKIKNNKKVKFLLESVAADERKHHELLHKIMDLVVRKEAITEDDWWDILWKNVPFHGAPGG